MATETASRTLGTSQHSHAPSPPLPTPAPAMPSSPQVVMPAPLDRHPRKRPFAGWMKRLANLKPSSSDSPTGSGKKSSSALEAKAKKAAAKNYPYPESACANNAAAAAARPSVSTTDAPRSHESLTSAEGSRAEQNRAKSTAPTVATVPETVHSMRSKADTGSNFVGGNSTFSSPNASEHSLTTTLTTIQSTAPSNVLAAAQSQPAPATAPPVHFSHQFPTSPPPSAIPPHLAPHSYQGATANNILTDNASILTLASSSKRRRRNSADTNASVRALAPSSQYGGSRESLPLSILSATPDAIYSPATRPGAFANAERVSVYSASGVTAPVLTSERNSYYAAKQNADGLSVRSGLLGHGRTESISSMRANPTSPLASPRDAPGPAKISRQSLDWTREASDDEEGAQSQHVPADKGKARGAL